MKKIFNLTMLVACFSTSLIYGAVTTFYGPKGQYEGQAVTGGVQILPGRSTAGRELGKGLAKGISKAIEDAERKRQAELEMEFQREEEARCNQLINDFIYYYDPAKHSQCISKVLQSSLPNESKKFVVDHLNKEREEYLKDKR